MDSYRNFLSLSNQFLPSSQNKYSPEREGGRIFSREVPLGPLPTLHMSSLRANSIPERTLSLLNAASKQGCHFQVHPDMWLFSSISKLDSLDIILLWHQLSAGQATRAEPLLSSARTHRNRTEIPLLLFFIPLLMPMWPLPSFA